jgi:hypothetical protein
VHCQTTRANCLARFRRRAERGERHWVHFDREWLAENDAEDVPFNWNVYEPLDLDVPILRIDTTAGYAPDLPQILRFIRSA